MAISATAAKFDIEHIADDEPENPQAYWHVQALLLSEFAVTLARGLRPGMGIEAQLPLRIVRDRVHYEDLARQSYTPPSPDLHHRNETLAGLADPQLSVHFGHQLEPWTLAARIGVSAPIGRTEPNPFELGNRGLRHQHTQFGSGTWDPILGVAVGHSFGALHMQLGGIARLTLAENEHGYRAGNRYSLPLGAARGLGKSWNANVGLMLAREEPEEWGGRIEDEGNLGRTDLLLSLGAGRVIASLGGFALNLQLPIVSETTGEQVKIPVIFSLAWTR